MDQKWYYEDHGRAKGPISTRDLVNKIQKGEMTLVDLVFKEGNPSWCPAESFSEITEMIGNISLQDSADWIVLKSANVDGKTIHEQIGPFNAQQILDLIDRGKIRFSDYVWRTGYEKWVPLGRVDEFEKPLRSSVEVDKSLYSKPRHFDLLQPDKKDAPLKKVTPVVMQSRSLQQEPKPIEAKGEDIVAVNEHTHTRIIHRTEVVIDKPMAKKIQQPVVAAVVEKKKPQRRETDLPPLPEPKATTKLKEDLVVPEKLLGEKIPIFDEPSALQEKAKRPEKKPPLPRATAKGETFSVEISTAPPLKPAEKAKTKDLPPLPNSTPVKERVQESLEKAAKDERQDQATSQVLVQSRWMPIGVTACFMVIVFSAGLFVIVNKKKMRSGMGNGFSIKMDPRPVKTVKSPVKVKKPQTVADRPTPKPVPSNVSKSIPTSTVVSAKPQVVPVEHKEYDVAPTVGGSQKNRSYYHHKERIYLFYTSNEGEQLAGELHKAFAKHQNNTKQWKSFYGSWKNRTKTYITKVNTEARKARLHRSLFKELMSSASDLDDIGRDINVQMTEGRGPSKVASTKNLESQFKNIGSNARNLDR